MTSVQLEVCVDTIDGAIAAQTGGADRIELCSALSEGGLTPSAGLMGAVAELDIPAYAMIRPRCGNFKFSATEIQVMLDDIAAAKAAGLVGVVLGVQKADGALDMSALATLNEAAGNLGKTLHRVIDVTPDPLAALEDAISLGFERVLTSGAAAKAVDGVDTIRKMVALAGDRISIMPGSGLTEQNISGFLTQTGVTEVHASCSVPVLEEESFSNFSPPTGCKETCSNKVKQMKRELSA